MSIACFNVIIMNLNDNGVFVGRRKRAQYRVAGLSARKSSDGFRHSYLDERSPSFSLVAVTKLLVTFVECRRDQY